MADDKPKRGGRDKKVRNPGSGKAPVNTSARGAGWGGPAKGKMPHSPRFTGGKEEGWHYGYAAIGERDAAGRLLPSMSIRGIADAELKDELQSLWLDVSRNTAEPTLNRMTAADKLYDRRFPKLAPASPGDDDKTLIIRIEGGLPDAGS